MRPRGVLAAVLLAALTALAAGCSPYLYPHGPETQNAALQADAVIMRDGARLPLRRWGDRTDPSAVILALHGFNDYSNAFDGAGEGWAADGILTYAYDQRGFGRAPHRGRWAGVETLTSDLYQVAMVLKARHPDKPLIVVGESMGGAVALTASAAYPDMPADRMVLSAPAVWGRETMPGWQRAMLGVLANTLPWLEVSPRHIRRKPSDNVPMLRALGRDPLVIKRTRVDAIWGLVNLMDSARAAAPGLRHPAMILYGENEDILPSETWRSMIATLPENGKWRLRLYDKGFHMLLRDLNAAAVIADISRYALTGEAAAPDREARNALPLVTAAQPLR